MLTRQQQLDTKTWIAARRAAGAADHGAAYRDYVAARDEPIAEHDFADCWRAIDDDAAAAKEQAERAGAQPAPEVAAPPNEEPKPKKPKR